MSEKNNFFFFSSYSSQHTGLETPQRLGLGIIVVSTMKLTTIKKERKKEKQSLYISVQFHQVDGGMAQVVDLLPHKQRP
jgi:hypothetical protein